MRRGEVALVGRRRHLVDGAAGRRPASGRPPARDRAASTWPPSRSTCSASARTAAGGRPSRGTAPWARSWRADICAARWSPAETVSAGAKGSPAVVALTLVSPRWPRRRGSRSRCPRRGRQRPGPRPAAPRHHRAASSTSPRIPTTRTTRVLVRLSRGHGVRSALLTLTRGEGGPERARAPSCTRPSPCCARRSCAAVHRYDGGRAVLRARLRLRLLVQRRGEPRPAGVASRRWATWCAVVRTFRPDVILTMPLRGRGRRRSPSAPRAARARGLPRRRRSRCASRAARARELRPGRRASSTRPRWAAATRRGAP